MDAGTLDRPGILQHTLTRPDGWLDCATVLDVGAGIRPCVWYPNALHVCVEPYGRYSEILRREGFAVHEATAEEALATLRAEAVLLLDVIEHMDRETGLRVLELAKAAAGRQLIVFTPLGFMPQDEDKWGLGGHEWQRHRSGWTPDDFQGWKIQTFSQTFFAIWNP